jgi:hypothetical protein
LPFAGCGVQQGALHETECFLHGADEVVGIRLEEADGDVIGMVQIKLDIKCPKGVSLPVIGRCWYMSETMRSSGAAKPNRTASQDIHGGFPPH